MVKNLNNPFESEAAILGSCYTGIDEQGILRGMREGETRMPHKATRYVHSQFTALIREHPCAGAFRAFRDRTYRFGLYEEMADAQVTEALCYDLYEYLLERTKWNSIFTAFVASFTLPRIVSEEDFEELLWGQVQLISDRDKLFFEAADGYPTDPKEDDFCLSFGKVGLFVAAFQPDSNRYSRRFGYCTLVFNPQQQFDDARETGVYAQISRSTRAQQIKLDGDINPNSDFGYAMQFTGMIKTPETFKCPYHR